MLVPLQQHSEYWDRAMLRMFGNYLGMIRFSHTIFALPFAFLSATLAWRDVPIRWNHFAGILLCLVTGRSAAMACNRLLDRDIDAANPRTMNRHLATGILSVGGVIIFTVVSSIAFISSTFLFYLNEPPNPWPARLSAPILIF